MQNRFRSILCLPFCMSIALLWPGSMSAADPKLAVTVKPVAEGVYLVLGGAPGDGNAEFLVGDKGIVLIDTKGTAASGVELLRVIHTVSLLPITHVILTHSDEDHINGLTALPKGIPIIAQANAKKEMQAQVAKPLPELLQYLPMQLIDTHASLTLDGIHLELLHVANAHTSGDLVIYLPEKGIVLTGDLLSPHFPYPIIHLNKNGSSQGWIETMQRVVQLNATLFVPGHGDPQPKSVVVKKLEDTIARRAEIEQLYDKGDSLAQIKEALGERGDAPQPAGAPVFASFTGTVYKELSSGAAPSSSGTRD